MWQKSLKKYVHPSAISRNEDHAEDIKLSTLEKVAHALGKRLEVKIA
jgi:HTH-type transcriptional regulator/antitoxin HipB